MHDIKGISDKTMQIAVLQMELYIILIKDHTGNGKIYILTKISI